MNHVVIACGRNNVAFAGAIGAFLVKAQPMSSQGKRPRIFRGGHTILEPFSQHIGTVGKVFHAYFATAFV